METRPESRDLRAANGKASAPAAIKLYKSLLGASLLNQADIDHVSTLSEQTGEHIDQVLLTLGLVEEAALAIHMADATGAQFQGELDLGDLSFFNDEVNIAFCRRKRIIPACFRNGDPIILVPNALDHAGICAMKFLVGAEAEVIVTPVSSWEYLFSAFLEEQAAHAENDDDIVTDGDFSADANRLRDLASEEPIVRLVGQTIADAVRRRASDIHLDPDARQSALRYRIDGVLQDINRISAARALSFASRIKILANLDIAERRRPQDGGFSIAIGGRPIDMRVSTVPTEYGESIVLRVLDQDTVALSLDALGYSIRDQETLQRLSQLENGFVLVTGPTGSGKTTTLYSLLEAIADGEKKILTIEDPIEQRLDNVTQTQVNTAIGVTFAAGLRSFLRHDPDVIMVGEIRDRETAQIAVQAALTGHLVFATLHTNDAVSAVTRLLDIGIEDYLIAAILKGVVAQRLVRKICATCRGSGVFEDATCQVCNGVGRAGRIAIAEVLELDDKFRELLRDGWRDAEVETTLRENGFVFMQDDARQKVSDGAITQSDVVKAIGAL